ncbi:MAG: hypothetical protein ACO2PK_10280 [Armatimonadota bacterium]
MWRKEGILLRLMRAEKEAATFWWRLSFGGALRTPQRLGSFSLPRQSFAPARRWQWV